MSNRAPIRVVHEAGKQRIEPTVGGVGSTFLRLLEHQGGLWIAWSGTQTKTPGRLMMPPGSDPPRFQIVFCPLSERDVSHYYYGMCNRALWPLMHFMTASCHFNTRPLALLRSGQRNFAALPRRAGRRRRRGVDAGLPSRAGPRICCASSVHASRDRDFLARAVSARASSFASFRGARNCSRGCSAADLVGFHTALLRHPVSQLLRADPGPARRSRRATRLRLIDGPVRVGDFSARHSGRLFRQTSPPAPRVQERTRAFAAHCVRRDRGARRRPARLHQGHPRAPARFRAIPRSATPPTIGASPWC